MTSLSWDPLLEGTNKPLDYGASPLKIQFIMHMEGAIKFMGLSNWMTLDTLGSD